MRKRLTAIREMCVRTFTKNKSFSDVKAARICQRHAQTCVVTHTCSPTGTRSLQCDNNEIRWCNLRNVSLILTTIFLSLGSRTRQTSRHSESDSQEKKTTRGVAQWKFWKVSRQCIDFSERKCLLRQETRPEEERGRRKERRDRGLLSSAPESMQRNWRRRLVRILCNMYRVCLNCICSHAGSDETLVNGTYMSVPATAGVNLSRATYVLCRRFMATLVHTYSLYI